MRIFRLVLAAAAAEATVRELADLVEANEESSVANLGRNAQDKLFGRALSLRRSACGGLENSTFQKGLPLKLKVPFRGKDSSKGKGNASQAGSLGSAGNAPDATEAGVSENASADESEEPEQSHTAESLMPGSDDLVPEVTTSSIQEVEPRDEPVAITLPTHEPVLREESQVDEAAITPVVDPETLVEVGIYCWDPAELPKKDLRDVVSEDIAQGLRRENALPEQVVSKSSIVFPVMFPDLSPDLLAPAERRFPFDAGFIVPMFVAKERGIDLQSVDFILGGSSLNILATHENGNDANTKYLVQKCSTTDVILVAEAKQDLSENADFGVQFDRLLTGRPLNDKFDYRTFASLRLARVGGFTVLFVTNVHAVNEEGSPVKLASGSPHHGEMDLLLDMVASGSETLMMGNRGGPIVWGVNEKSFDDLAREQSNEDVAAIKANISESLNTLQRWIATDAPTELGFDRQGSMVLKPYLGGDLLPPVNVVEQLLGGVTKPTTTELKTTLPADGPEQLSPWASFCRLVLQGGGLPCVCNPCSPSDQED